MKCPNCQRDNPPAAKFCESCAAPLLRLCANCKSPASPDAKYCSQCGHALSPLDESNRFSSPRNYTPQHLVNKILTSRAALEGERKQITVLFADIKGSMEVITDRDVEDAQKLLHAVLERMIEAVHRYEGTVNSVMGDGIMALFGAPLALEDHAVRACYAALRMQESIARYSDEVQRTHGVPIMTRVGVNSGEIVISAIGNDLHMEYTVVGPTVHLAARMEQMAKPGSVLTTAQTHRLAEGFIAMKPLGPAAVKGLAEPVPIFEVSGAGPARTRLQAAAGRGLTRFVGRELEFEQLRRALQLAGQGEGQVVALVGQPGVGKSRLMHEFLHSDPAAGWLVLESNTTSYDHATSYLPITELLRGYFKVDAREEAQSTREKVSGKILTLNPSLQDAVLPVLDLLNALDEDHPFRALEPDQHRQSTYQAVIRLLLSESRLQPVIAIFEDLQWYDSLTLGLLNELAVRAQDARLLLVVSYRPEFQDGWKHRPNYRQLHLNPLASENLAALLQALLGSNPNLQILKNFLMQRASGNPFFVEEIVRALADNGVIEGSRSDYRLAKPFVTHEIPPTVQAVLAARIDALPSAEKRLLQEASVIGHDVLFALLHAISGLPEDELQGLLEDVQASEFLYATQLFPDLQYTFTHSLTHDVTYNGVLLERRREIHARIVDAIERLYAGRLGDQVERLAHHAVRGDLKDKAVHYLRQSGAKAATRSALADARSCFEQALDILKTLPSSQSVQETAFDVRLELRPVLRQLGEGRHMLDHLREAEAVAVALHDDRRRGLACSFMTTVYASVDELDEAAATGMRALEIAERLGDAKLRLVSKSYLGQVHCYRAEYERVIELATANLASLPAEWINEHFGMSVPAAIFDRAWIIMSLAELGRFAEAAKYEGEAIRIAEATDHAFSIGWAHLAASMPHLLKGDWVKARTLVEYWIATLRSGNVAIHLPWAMASSAWTLAQIGAKDQALERVEEAEELLERQAAHGIVGHRGWAYHAVGRACLLLGRLDKARQLAERAVGTSQHQPGFAAHALHLLGDLAAQPDRFDAENSMAHYREALAVAQKHGMRPLIAHCHFGLGRVYDRLGKPEAHKNLAAAATMYRDMDMAFWLKQTES
ncbi:MAG TPA: adenylate/guanylate cyclase domain-containing protein [Xanthobacteraceae bacterium]|jgi:class 3 adenylate cyclase/tetratricopeptide (TPR) repeat protein|nr:adenylate/guanylate cyclase domain-containing protein [Xanthobacteraceae bacterium]